MFTLQLKLRRVHLILTVTKEKARGLVIHLAFILT